jgi:protein-tyrosine sulfotransferase
MNAIAGDLGRRIYNRLRCLIEGPRMRDRVVVKVVEGGEREHLPPAFIIGVYRSGTTLLRYVLDSHSRIAVPPESNFLLPLADFRHNEWVAKGLAGVGVDDAGLAARLRDLAWSVLDDYARAKGKQRWVDKTPSYVQALDFLDELFGSQCRYIMLYRHGLDVANSMASERNAQVTFGPAQRYVQDGDASPRIAFARYWADQCERMLAFEERFPERCLRLRYEDFSADPQGRLPAVFDFLGETWEPQVLDFQSQSHDFGLQDSKILETKGFKPQTHKYRTWEQAEIDAAAEVAGKTLEKLGYSV